MSTNPVPHELAQDCLRLLELEDRLSNLKKKMREINKEKKKLTKTVFSEMKALKFTEVNTNKGVISIENISRKESINETFLQSTFMEMYKDRSKADDVTSKIIKNRKVKGIERIRITANK